MCCNCVFTQAWCTHLDTWISYKDKQLLYNSGGGGGESSLYHGRAANFNSENASFPQRQITGRVNCSQHAGYLAIHIFRRLEIIQTVPDPEGHQLVHAVTTPIYVRWAGEDVMWQPESDMEWLPTVRRRVSIQTVRNRLMSKWNISKIVMFWVFLHLT